jgi:hypothetical protein
VRHYFVGCALIQIPDLLLKIYERFIAYLQRNQGMKDKAKQVHRRKVGNMSSNAAARKDDIVRKDDIRHHCGEIMTRYDNEPTKSMTPFKYKSTQ